MIRLVLSDLTAHARVWFGVLAVTTATGFVGAVAAGLIETGIAYGGRVLSGLGSTSSAVIMFTAVTAVIVLGSTTNLTVALQRRDYALWQLVGVRPALVALAVLAQLGVVGAVGAFAGCLAAMPIFPPLFTWAFRTWPDMQGITLQIGSISALAVTAAVTGVVLLSGVRGARNASRTPPVEALRDPEPRRIRMGWLRIVLTVLLLGGAIAVAQSLDGRDTIGAFSGRAILLTPLIAAALATAGPALFPLALRAWTALLPARASASWFLARNSARYRLSQSSAAISPLMIAIALAGGLYTTSATLAARAAQTGASGRFDLAPEGVVILLGGPLLLSAVASAATVFMTGHAREREFALIQAAGSTRGAIILAASWEAVIYVITATILGTAAIAIGGVIVAAALSLPLVASFPTIGLIAGAGFVLILAATAAPTVAALRHEIPRTLAVE
ncbi:FtsX-like permease family protein [Microbacterium sp. X-17]|uniref:FtsX-like permease family protein n=1 Tax=Microbacterium sp. X-17 TaxID=3144404 RepID=UPI0031F56754